MIALTLAEWEAEGLRRFGPDRYAWRFGGPSCGHGGELALERNPVRVVTDDGRSSVLFPFAEPA